MPKKAEKVRTIPVICDGIGCKEIIKVSTDSTVVDGYDSVGDFRDMYENQHGHGLLCEKCQDQLQWFSENCWSCIDQWPFCEFAKWIDSDPEKRNEGFKVPLYLGVIRSGGCPCFVNGLFRLSLDDRTYVHEDSRDLSSKEETTRPIIAALERLSIIDNEVIG